MKRMFRDQDQRYTNDGITLDYRLEQEFETTMLQEIESGASLNELELLMIRAVISAAGAIRLDYERHVSRHNSQAEQLL